MQPKSIPASPGRWSASAWLLVRGAGAEPLARVGALGGSQAGIRLTYRVAGGAEQPLALSGRLYSPLVRRRSAEASLGLDWRPVAGLPVHLLAERRQALGEEGRSAFALTLHGGVAERPLLGRLELDAYVQAGVVGARSRDLFADGSARLGVPVGDLRVGAGVWGGTQPGAERLDVGPQASIRLPALGGTMRLSAEWRFRIAGQASPGSGPAFTLGSDF